MISNCPLFKMHKRIFLDNEIKSGKWDFFKRKKTKKFSLKKTFAVGLGTKFKKKLTFTVKSVRMWKFSFWMFAMGIVKWSKLWMLQFPTDKFIKMF